MSLIYFLEFFYFILFFPFSDCVLQTVLKVEKASGISVFGLWKQTGLNCNYTQYYRNDLIDRMDNTCIKNLDIYFRSQTAYFLIRYTTPFSGFSLESILSTKPSSIDDNGADIAGTTYSVLINSTDGYEFALLNSNQTKIHAGIYYQVQDPLSPKFEFSSAGITYQKVQMYASSVTNFSSQYTALSGWTAIEILGAPNVYPNYGYLPKTWAANCCSNKEFIQVAFSTSIYIEAVNIYETVNAGGVKRVSGKMPNGTWYIMWQTSKVTVISNSRIFSPPFTKLSFPCNELKLEIDNTAAKTWVEFDAIQISGTPLDITSDQTSSYLEIIADVYDGATCIAQTTTGSITTSQSTATSLSTATPGSTTSSRSTTISLSTATLGSTTITQSTPNQVPEVAVHGSISVISGNTSTIVITCTIVSNVPVTAVRWTKNGNDLSVVGNPRYSGVVNGTHNLTINSADLSDSGYYMCYASNVLGEGHSENISLIVQQPSGCFCDCQPRLEYFENHTTAEWKQILAPVIVELKKNLTVDKTGLSKTIGKRTCAYDRRSSSKSIGLIGVLIISVLCCAIVLVDISPLLLPLLRHIRNAKKEKEEKEQ